MKKELESQQVSSGKADAAPPQITIGEDVELASLRPEEAKLPLLEDIMQLSRLGDIGPIRKLFDEGKITVDFKDKEGITPLHVCASESTRRLAKDKNADEVPVGCYQQPLRSL